MENENIRENENLNPEEIEKESTSPESEEVLEEALTETVTFEESDGEGEENAADEALENGEISEDAEELIGDEWQDAEDEDVIKIEPLSEEELAAIKEAKRKRTFKILLITGIAIVVLAIVAAWSCYVEGVGSNTAIETPVTMADDGEDNIKFENPVSAIFNTVTGRGKDTAMTINGKAVDKNIFSYVTNLSGINCAYSLIQTGMLQDLEGFEWNTPEYSTGMSYLNYAKGMAIDTLIPIYTLIEEGEKQGVALSEEEEKEITDNVAELKAQYGDQFETILLQNGYPDEETLVNIQRIDALMQKVYEDAEADISKYASVEEIIKYQDEEKVTVKHILVAFDESAAGDVTDEKKAAAKTEAEEVLKKVRNGEDFDKLIEEYNDAPGLTAEGYTFADDGTMVQAFTDASFALKEGEVSDIVETSYGYHIIKRIERAVTVSEYMEMLKETAKVRVRKGNFKDANVTIDLASYFGEGAAE